MFTSFNPDLEVEYVNSTFYTTHQTLLSGNGTNIYDESQWTSVKIEDEKNVMPIETPAFIVIEGTNGKEEFKIAHLQRGAKKEAYTDLLDSYQVKNYCDSFSFFGKDFKLGSSLVCGWKPEELKAELPKTEETETE